MREDEVDQSEEEETAEEHQDDDETGGISEPLRNMSMNTSTSTDFSEISDDEEQNSITIRRLRTVYSDQWLSDEKAEEIIHKVKKSSLARLTSIKRRRHMHLRSSRK